MARSIGATLSLNNGNFFTNMKSATNAAKGLKTSLTNATSTMKSHGSMATSVGTKLKSLIGVVGGVVAAYASFSAIKKFTSEAIAAANEQASAEKRLETTMSNVAGTTKTQIDGIKTYAAEMQKVTTVGDEVSITGASQLATFQLQADTIKTLMPSLNDLAVAQYGVSVSSDQMQSMANLMGKVMTGNVGALTRYGVTMNDTQKKILQTGTESEKAAMLVEVLGKNFGGLAEAMANTPEGRIQQLKNAWGDMQEVVGAQLYPVITKLLTYITDRIPKIQAMFSSIMTAIQPALSWIADTALPTIGSVAEAVFTGFGETLSALKPMFDGIKYLFDAFGQTMKAVFESPAIEHFKAALQTVGDALNAAFSNTTAMDNITGLFGDLITSVVDVMSEIITAVSPLLPTVMDIVGSIAGAAKALLPPIVQLIKGTVKAVAPVIKSIGDGVKSLVSAIAPIIEKLAVLLQPVISIVSGIAQVLGAVLAPVITVISGLLTGIIKVVDGILGVVVGAWNIIKSVFAPVFQFFSEIFQSVKTVVIGAWNSIKEAIRPVWDAIKTVWDSAAPYFQGIGDWIKQVFGVVGTFIGGAFQTAWTSIKFIWDTATDFFSAVWDTISGIFSVVGSVLTGDWAGAWEGIKGIVGTWGEFFSGVWDGIKGIFASVGSWFGSTFSAAWSAVKSAFSGVTSFFANMWNTIKNTFVNIGTTIANGISGAFKSVINAVIGFASNTINGFIRSINWAVGVINKIPGVNIPSLKEISLPRLANGGIATTATIAEIGEAGDEAVLPLTAFWNKLEDYLVPQPQAAGAVTNNIYVTVDGHNADDETLANRVAHRIVAVIENM